MKSTMFKTVIVIDSEVANALGIKKDSVISFSDAIQAIKANDRYQKRKPKLLPHFK